jgi:hypothetical protein
MPATIQTETTVDNQNPLAVFDALGIDPKARFQFGKWKTYTVDWARKCEPSYLRWLADQDWFRADHPRMVTVDSPKPKEAKPVVRKPSRRHAKAIGELCVKEWTAGAIDQTESLPPAPARLAFSVAGNVIQVAAWSR